MSAPTSPFRARSLLLQLLAALAAGKALFLGAHLHYPDLVLDYPFPGGDGYEWISNGLAWAGAATRTTARPPVLPWIVAALDRLGGLAWWPALQQLVLPAGVLALYVTLARWHAARVAFLASLVPLVSSAATGHGLELMADTLAGVLLFFAVAFFLAAERRPWLYAAAGAAAAASALTQHIGLLFAPVAAAALVACRREDLGRPQVWVGATLFAVPCAAWFAAKAVVYGSAGDVADQHWGLIQWPGLGALPYYTVAAAGLIALPALLLAVTGAVRLLRPHRREARTWLVLGLIVAVSGFFVFFFGFRQQRLLLYVLLPLAVLVAEGLAALRRPALQWVAGAAAVLWSAWPVPGAPAIDGGMTLLPVPGSFVYLHPAAPPRLRAGPADAWRESPWSRVLHASSLRPRGPSLDAEPLRPGVVVFLYRPGDSDHYVTQHRLGDALRRRVQWVAQDLYPPDWWGWQSSRFVGEADAFAFFRVALPLPPPHDVAWIAFHRDDPGWRGLLAAPHGGSGPPGPDVVANARRFAAEIERRLPPGDPFVTVIGQRDDERLRLLPFQSRTSSLFVLAGDEGRAALVEQARNPMRPLGEADGVPLFATRLWGWKTLLAVASSDP